MGGGGVNVIATIATSATLGSMLQILCECLEIIQNAKKQNATMRVFFYTMFA